MSSIVGDGTLKCFLHDFETTDINEWNDHCINEGHTEEGSTCCIGCGVRIEFSNLPYHPITPNGKNIALRCDTCTESEINALQSSNVTKKLHGIASNKGGS